MKKQIIKARKKMLTDLGRATSAPGTLREEQIVGRCMRCGVPTERWVTVGHVCERCATEVKEQGKAKTNND